VQCYLGAHYSIFCDGHIFLFFFVQIEVSAGVQIPTSSSTANDRPLTGSTIATIGVSKCRPLGAWRVNKFQQIDKKSIVRSERIVLKTNPKQMRKWNKLVTHGSLHYNLVNVLRRFEFRLRCRRLRSFLQIMLMSQDRHFWIWSAFRRTVTLPLLVPRWPWPANPGDGLHRELSPSRVWRVRDRLNLAEVGARLKLPMAQYRCGCFKVKICGTGMIRRKKSRGVLLKWCQIGVEGCRRGWCRRHSRWLHWNETKRNESWRTQARPLCPYHHLSLNN